MSDDGYHEIVALRAELVRVTRERDQSLAHLDLAIEALEAIRLHEIVEDEESYSGQVAKQALALVRPSPVAA